MPGSVSLWTVEEINARLGISTAIYQKYTLSARHIAKIREVGIRRVEILVSPGCFDYHNDDQVAEILGECRKQGVKVVAVHGLLKLPYKSKWPEEQELVMRESLSGIRFAEEAGASIYVAHFGYNEHSKKIVTELLEQTDGYSIKLTTENRGAIPNYIPIVDDISSDRFGLTVDIGHPRDSDGVNPFVKSERARQAMVECGDRVFHLHLHETFDLDRKPDHRAPMHKDGIIEWGEVFAALKDVGYKGELLFEDGRGENPEEWAQMTAAFPKNFVRRYY
jgi:sugar phosphate isomerase/epimerase